MLSITSALFFKLSKFSNTRKQTCITAIKGCRKHAFKLLCFKICLKNYLINNKIIIYKKEINSNNEISTNSTLSNALLNTAVRVLIWSTIKNTKLTLLLLLQILCIFPRLVTPWPVSGVALWIGQLQDILIPIGLGIVDSRFCKWVSKVYKCAERRKVVDKVPPGGK